MKQTSLLMILAGLLTIACSQDNAGNKSKPNESSSTLAPSTQTLNYADYFPYEPGTRWTYAVKVGPGPIVVRLHYWPYRQKTRSYTSLGKISMPPGTPDTLTLVVSVKGRAEQQGPFTRRNAVEIAVEKDELGLYQGVSQIFWAVSPRTKFDVEEIVTLDSLLSAPYLPEGDTENLGQGFSTKQLFFVATDPGTANKVDLGDGEQLKTLDWITFKSLEGDQLHYVRTYEDPFDPSTDTAHRLKGIQEHLWYGRGKGLIRFEQVVDGKTTMIWELTGFDLHK